MTSLPIPISTGRRLALTVVLAICALAATSARADAAISCAVVADSLLIGHPDGHSVVTIRVAGPDVDVLEQGIPKGCGNPRLDSLTDIHYDHSGGISTFVIEDPEKFAPGIETTANDTSPDGGMTQLWLQDDDGAPVNITLGTDPTSGDELINVNPDEAVDRSDIIVRAPAARFHVGGTAGDDRLDARGGDGTGGPFAAILALAGGPGDDLLFGGAGRDLLDGGSGDDLLDGGDEFDRTSYESSEAPVAIDLAAGGPQDGGSLGRDTLVSVEGISGSEFGDVLRGDDGDNLLFGFGGDDLIQGRAGDDDLLGGSGIDTVTYADATGPVAVDLGRTTSQDTGGSGTDTIGAREIENIIGGPAGDTLRGTSGANRIDGAGGADTIAALGGDDTVLARDGLADAIDCGTGTDAATLDAPGVDRPTGCEATDLAPGPTQGGAAGQQADRTVALALRGARRQRLRARGIRVKASCPAEACTIVASARAGRRLRFHRVRAVIAQGTAGKIRLRLSRAKRVRAQRALRRGRRLIVRVRVTATDAAGNRTTATRKIRLVAKRR